MLGRGVVTVMLTRLPEPEGVPLTEKDAPEFFALIHQISKDVGAPRIDSVKLDFSVNAYIAEIPRWGALGPFKRYLVMGVPLLLVRSLGEFKYVLAHELAHLSNAHGKSGFRIHRAAELWKSIAGSLKSAKPAVILLVWPFIVRYVPTLIGESFEHSRQNEFVADAAAARVTSPEAAASALLKLALYDSFLIGAFTRTFDERVAETDRPPERVAHELEAFCAQPLRVEEPQAVLERVMSTRSLPTWTHPSYAERLANMGATPRWPEETDVNTLRALWGDGADEALDRVSVWWAADFKETWAERHNKIRTALTRLNELEGKLEVKATSQAGAGPVAPDSGVDAEPGLGSAAENAAKSAGETGLTRDEAIERALLMERLEGDARALEAFKALHAEHPDDVAAAFHTGRLMIETGDEEGEALLVKTVELDPQTLPECCAVLYWHYRRKGEIERELGYYREAVSFMCTNDEVKKEREALRLDDDFAPHDLELEAVERLRDGLSAKGYVTRAYLAVKQLKYSGDFPLYVLAVKFRDRTSGGRKKLLQELVESDFIPWDLIAVPIFRRNRTLELKISMLPHTRIV